MRRLVAGLCVVLAVAGCQDVPPTDPGAVPRMQLSSSSHASMYFSFLSPVPPGATPPAGVFHEYAAPVLDICRVVDGGCDPVASTSLSTRSTNSIDLITVDDINEQYQANWTNLNALPRGAYRLSVRARPLNAPSQPLQFLGETTVQLVTSGGSGLNVSGNTLPIKFRILVGAFCVDASCAEIAFDNATGGQYILDEVDLVGTFGIRFDPNFLCGPNQTNCADGRIVLTISRYTGPDRCIPVGYAAIQWESCITLRAEPYGVRVTGVTIGQCIEPRADTYASSGHLRLLKVKEDAQGNVLPNEIVDLNATLGGSFFFECSDEFDGTLMPSGQASASGLVQRLADGAQRALRPLGRLLTPRPAYARNKGPFVASLEDFSRIGPVLPVYATFDRNNAIGQPGVQLAEASAPRARVRATRIPGSTYFLTGDRGVADVPVTFTTQGGASHVVFTNTDGFASAQWVLGPVASNPQTLLAQVGYPAPSADPDIDSFPNPQTPWASFLFTAYAQEYKTYFLSPLGSSSGGTPNVTNVVPSVRVCGPLPDGSTNEPGQTCPGALLLPAPTLARNGSAWETAWKTDKNTVNNSLYRIEVLVNGAPTGGFLLRRGGGGGSDPVGTYQFQTGSNLPIKFTLER